jgi:hypothetical protein
MAFTTLINNNANEELLASLSPEEGFMLKNAVQWERAPMSNQQAMFSTQKLDNYFNAQTNGNNVVLSPDSGPIIGRFIAAVNGGNHSLDAFNTLMSVTPVVAVKYVLYVALFRTIDRAYNLRDVLSGQNLVGSAIKEITNSRGQARYQVVMFFISRPEAERMQKELIFRAQKFAIKFITEGHIPYIIEEQA